MPPSAPSISSVRGSDNPACVRLYLTTSVGATSYLIQFSTTNLFDNSAPIEPRGPFSGTFPSAATFFAARADWTSPLSATQAAFDAANGYAFDPSHGGLILLKIPLARPVSAGDTPSWVSALSTGSTIYVRAGASNDGGLSYAWSSAISFTTAVVVDGVAVTNTEDSPYNQGSYLTALAGNAYKYYEFAGSQSGNDNSNISGIFPSPNSQSPPIATVWQHNQMVSFNKDTSAQDANAGLSYKVNTTINFSSLAANASGPSGSFSIVAGLS